MLYFFCKKSISVVVFFILIILLSLNAFSQSAEINNFIDSVKTKINTSTNDTAQVNKLLLEVEKLKSENPTKAEALAKFLLEYTEKINYCEGKANALMQLGLLSFQQSNYFRANNFYKEELIARKICKSKEEKIIDIFCNMGNVYYEQGNFVAAMDYYIKAMHFADSANIEVSKAKSLILIGNIHANLKEYETAMNYYKKALAISIEINSKKNESSALNNIGTLLKVQQRNSDALPYYEKSLEIKEKLNDLKGTATTLGNIGDVYANLGQFNKSLVYHKKALKIREKLMDMDGISWSWFSMGNIYFKQKMYEKAIECYNKSLEIATNKGHRKKMKDNYMALSKSFENMQMIKEAFEYQKKYIQVTEELFGSEIQKQIAEMQAKYEAEKMEQEKQQLLKQNELHKMRLRNNRIILWIFISAFCIIFVLSFYLLRNYKQKQRINKELELLNHTLEDRINIEVQKSRQKDLMLIQQSRQAAMGEMIGNIAHQWRQPLNAVGMIIQNFQEAYEYGELNKEYLQRNVNKSMEIIRYMSQTIDDFRNFFKPDKAKIKFAPKEIILQAISFLEANFKSYEITINTYFEENIEIMGFPNEYAQVLINILNNAKDAFLLKKPERKAQIDIKLYVENSRSVLTIMDNAGGIDNEILDKIFDPYFTTKESDKGTGLGLYMAKNIIEKNMDGILTAENWEQGAIFRIIV